MAKIEIDIDDELFELAKEASEEYDISLDEFINEALKNRLDPEVEEMECIGQ